METRTKLSQLILRLERLFHIDVKYLAHGGGWLTIGQITSTLSGLALALIFANVLPLEVYGTYKYVLAIISVLTISTLPGMNSTVAQAVAEGAEGSFLPAMYTKIRWGLLGSAACLGYAIYSYIAHHDITLASSFLLSAFFIPVMDSIGLYNTYLQSKQQFKTSIIYFVISQTIATFLLAAAAWLTHNTLIILFTYFTTWTIVRFICLQLTLKKFPPNKEILDKTISYGKHLSFLGIVGQIASYADSLLLFHFLGPIQVAINSVCSSPADEVRAFLKNVPTLLIPKFARKTIEEINTLLIKRLFILLGIGIAISVVLYAIMPFIFPLVFHKYASEYRLAQLYVFTIALRLPSSFFNSVIQSKVTHFKKKFLYIGTIPNIILIISLVILTPLYGVIGVIACRYLNLILSLAMMIWQWFTFTKHNTRA